MRKTSRVASHSLVISNSTLLPAAMASSGFPYFAFLEKDRTPFRQNQFVQVHSSVGKDRLSVSSLTADKDVKKEVGSDVIMRLTGDTLSIKKDADLSLKTFIEQLVMGESQEMFDIAFKQDLLKKAE